MKPLLNEGEFDATLKKLAADIVEVQKDFSKVAFVGIQTRGIPLADRLCQILESQGRPVLQGVLDINLYRDDLSLSAEQPIVKETRIDFDVDGKVIYLCDD